MGALSAWMDEEVEEGGESSGESVDERSRSSFIELSWGHRRGTEGARQLSREGDAASGGEGMVKVRVWVRPWRRLACVVVVCAGTHEVEGAAELVQGEGRDLGRLLLPVVGRAGGVVQRGRSGRLSPPLFGLWCQAEVSQREGIQAGGRGGLKKDSRPLL